jgi:eukaryotic-like serine/threonine-protein kinase
MALAPGTRLGPYEILSALGAGGMGEVYRARDTSLGRDIALKVLPEALAHDPDRLVRFEREARLLASLNHPNVAHIYGFDTAHGAAALVLELVEGSTLADRIARGPMPLSEALAIARQIADGLDAAHEQGIVHRDLKPANVIVRADGTVKILDFGLAKAMYGEPASADLSHSPTITVVGGTQHGVILGTAAYMSPEQARGHVLDKRTDIWAFGCVLYEMLTGRGAFAGATVSDTIAGILERVPDWRALPDTTPDAVRRLLARCLVKDHRQRLRDIGDARIEIDGALSEPQRGAPPRRTGLKARPYAYVFAALGGLAAGLVVAALWPLGSQAPARVTTTGPVSRLTAFAGLTTEPSISPDGRMIAYASNRAGDNLDVWIQQTSGGTAIRLTDDPADDREPDVSPDTGLVAFRSDRNPRGVYVVPALGGDARLVAPDGMAPRFSPDGRSIAYWTGSWLAPHSVGLTQRVFVVASAGGEPRQLDTGLDSAGDPLWLPDGRALLVFGRRSSASGELVTDWWRVAIDGGEPAPSGAYERLRAAGINIEPIDDQPIPQAWTDEGVLFTAMDKGEGRSIWRVPVDAASGRATGDPVRLTTGTTADAWPDVSQDGRLVFAGHTVNRGPFALPLDVNAGRATGRLQRMREDSSETGRTAISADGRLLVIPRYEFGGGSLWVRDIASGRERQIVATPRTPLNPTISASGQWIGYTVTAVNIGGNAGSGDGYVVSSSGGAPRKICERCELYHWMPDERAVLVLSADRRTLSRVDVATGTVVPVVSSGMDVDRPMVGPNAKWMTFNSTLSVVLAPLHADRATPEAEWTTVLETSRSTERTAGLSPDGRILYVLLEPDGFRCLYGLRLDPETGRPEGMPFLVHHFHDASRRWGSTGFGSAAVTGMFVADLFETTGNLWMTSLR